MRDKINELVPSLAEMIHAKLMETTGGIPLDGDETKSLTDLILAELDSLNGNN